MARMVGCTPRPMIMLGASDENPGVAAATIMRLVVDTLPVVNVHRGLE